MHRFAKKMSVGLTLSLLVGLLSFAATSFAAGARIYTPYTSLSAAPGETLSYEIELLNDSSDIQSADLSFDDGGHGWKAELTAGGHPIRQVSVKPKESQSVNLSLEVPLEVSKGEYAFKVNAGVFGALPLQVNVAEGGTYKTELTTEQPNMQGHTDSTFTYAMTLNNRTASKQQYALTAEAPAGWDAKFQVGGNNVTSVDVEPNGSQSITVNLTPAEKATADTYAIKIHAANNSTSADAELQAVITGTYSLDFTTSDQRLSANVTAGGTRHLEMVVQNTGSAELTDVSLTSQAPTDWDVTFEPKTIRSLKPGESAPVTATIKSSGKSLAGDYVVGMTAQSAEKSKDAAIRVTVKSSVLWGWIGVLIILAVLAGIYGLFRKYGRR
ncbi:NEW3 domain-containing protein [Cohnella sp. REN36]|uniref:COG1470 family protein n=1 Tax=Cohnella sp. REN36 TaxID=2887347 RepID=UPI001D132924|nr:NEW3 domain-containing protein [Cohnella sp. REN36]MCC3373435.1 NEW3 domain-containing protein [Cohnella sp. REN36]